MDKKKSKKLLPKDGNKQTEDVADLEYKGICSCNSELDDPYETVDYRSDYDSDESWEDPRYKPYNFWTVQLGDLSDSDRFYWKDTDSEYSDYQEDVICEEKQHIFNPDSLHAISAKIVCQAIKRANDLLTLPLPWVLKYHLLDIFANKTKTRREGGLRMKYTSIFVHKFGYITESVQYRCPLFGKRKSPLPKCLNVRALFTLQVRVKFLIEYLNLSIQKANYSMETFNVNKICHKCYNDIPKNSEQCFKHITDTCTVSQEIDTRFDYFLFHVVRGNDYICNFCRKTILIIPLEFKFRASGLITQKRSFQGLEIPFNWPD